MNATTVGIAPPTNDSSRSRLVTVLRVTSGNFLEMFDFFLYGFYATYIAKAFFPVSNEYASLMLTFVTFGAGFLMRPLGAIVLGAYIDRIGRRKGLIVTLSIMACGTLMIAFVPTYATLGVAAPLLVLAGRLLQGFSAGVELGGVSVYLSEMATPGHKGFYVSWQSASQQVAIIVAAALGYGLNVSLQPAQISEWGWRIPFVVGSLIVPFIFVIRRSLQETGEFLARTHHPSVAEVYRSMIRNWGVVLAGMMLVIMTTVSFYLITVYTPTFGRSVLKLSTTDSLIVTFCVGVSNFFWLPVMGSLSDRIGRRPILLGFTILTVLTAYPVLAWLVASLPYEHFSFKQLRTVVEQFTGQLCKTNPTLKGHLGLVKFTLRNKCREFIETETDRLAEIAFDRLFEKSQLCFYLECVECRFQLPSSIEIRSVGRLRHADE